MTIYKDCDGTVIKEGDVLLAKKGDYAESWAVIITTIDEPSVRCIQISDSGGMEYDKVTTLAEWAFNRIKVVGSIETILNKIIEKREEFLDNA